jgi:putative endonuclease
MKRLNFGIIAEYIVILIYRLKFYQILGHRTRFYSGEIDIIAQRANTLVFIEVKARSRILNESLVSTTQQNRIKRAAETFLSKNPRFSNYLIRFDLAIVSPYKLPKIIKNAW